MPPRPDHGIRGGGVRIAVGLTGFVTRGMIYSTRGEVTQGARSPCLRCGLRARQRTTGPTGLALWGVARVAVVVMPVGDLPTTAGHKANGPNPLP
jgi:hypothetical protein